MPGASLFLVEDEVLIRMMIADMVVEFGHRVVAEAGSIHEATSLAGSAQFDLALLEPLFVCKACGKRGADIRPNFEPARMGLG
jgi:DNA-binding NarL/FixJ family response regulator